MAFFSSSRTRAGKAQLTDAGMTTGATRCSSGACPNKATTEVRLAGQRMAPECKPHARIEIQLWDWGTR